MAPSLPPLQSHREQRSDSQDSEDDANADTSFLASLCVMMGRCVCRSSNEHGCCQRGWECAGLRDRRVTRGRYYVVAIDSMLGPQAGGSASYNIIVVIIIIAQPWGSEQQDWLPGLEPNVPSPRAVVVRV